MVTMLSAHGIIITVFILQLSLRELITALTVLQDVIVTLLMLLTILLLLQNIIVTFAVLQELIVMVLVLRVE